MKKLFLILATAAAAGMIVACEGPEGPMGPTGPQGAPGQNGKNGRDGQDGQDGKDGMDGGGMKCYTQEFTILPHRWVQKGKVNELNSFLFAAVEMPQLTQKVYDEGTVIAYIENVKGEKRGMPYVWHRGMEVDGGEEYLWTETYDFDFTAGEVGFYLKYSDFQTAERPTEPVTFHVVVIWQ